MWRLNIVTPNGVMERQENEEVKAGRGSIRGGEARSEAEGDDDRDRTGRRWGGLFSFETALGVSQAVAFTIGFEDVDAMGQPVEHGPGEPFAT